MRWRLYILLSVSFSARVFCFIVIQMYCSLITFLSFLCHYFTTPWLLFVMLWNKMNFIWITACPLVLTMSPNTKSNEIHSVKMTTAAQQSASVFHFSQSSNCPLFDLSLAFCRIGRGTFHSKSTNHKRISPQPKSVWEKNNRIHTDGARETEAVSMAKVEVTVHNFMRH